MALERYLQLDRMGCPPQHEHPHDTTNPNRETGTDPMVATVQPGPDKDDSTAAAEQAPVAASLGAVRGKVA